MPGATTEKSRPNDAMVGRGSAFSCVADSTGNDAVSTGRHAQMASASLAVKEAGRRIFLPLEVSLCRISRW